ncbi:MAG TPA: hypothetical protein VHC86_01370 [Opitutaceae bacterium]|nr:hypothetical protein [Opitutaceae bacterium]
MSEILKNGQLFANIAYCREEVVQQRALIRQLGIAGANDALLGETRFYYVVPDGIVFPSPNDGAAYELVLPAKRVRVALGGFHAEIKPELGTGLCIITFVELA